MKADVAVEDIPVETLNLQLGPITIGRMKKKKKKLTKKERKRLIKKGLPVPEESEDDEPVAVVMDVMDMPEGAADSDDFDDRDDNDPYRALDINLDAPLDDAEVLPVAAHHVAKSLTADEAAALEKQKAKDAKKAKKAAKSAKKEKKAKKEEKAKVRQRPISIPPQNGPFCTRLPCQYAAPYAPRTVHTRRALYCTHFSARAYWMLNRCLQSDFTAIHVFRPRRPTPRSPWPSQNRT